MGTLWSASVGLVNSIKSYNSHRNKSGLLHVAMRKVACAKHFVLSILTSSDLVSAFNSVRGSICLILLV
jgi:hypothetical protein